MADYSAILANVTQAELAKCNSGIGTPYDVAFLRISEDSAVDCFIRTYYGGDMVAMEEWEQRDRLFAIAGNADIDELHDLLTEGGKASLLIGAVIEGMGSRHDGSNTVGTITDDGRNAAEGLQEMLQSVGTSEIEAWEIESWALVDGPVALLEDLGLTMDSTPEQIAAAAVKMIQIAADDHVVLIGESAESVLAKAVADVKGMAEAADAE